MERQPVNSSNLVSAGYDPTTGTLEIEFKGGDVYTYSGVPQTIYDGLMSANSPGHYFHNVIRMSYPYKKG